MRQQVQCLYLLIFFASISSLQAQGKPVPSSDVKKIEQSTKASDDELQYLRQENARLRTQLEVATYKLQQVEAKIEPGELSRYANQSLVQNNADLLEKNKQLWGLIQSCEADLSKVEAKLKLILTKGKENVGRK